MDELVHLVALLQTSVFSRDGDVEQVDVHWVDPEGRKHVIVEVKRGSAIVEVDWKAGESFKLRLVTSDTSYHEASPEAPTAKKAMGKIIALLNSD